MRFGWPQAQALALSVASLGLFSSLAPTAALAQSGVPQGSYLSSCSNARMVDGILEASCRQADQQYRDTSLVNPFGCTNGVDNSNGKLVCSNPPAAQKITSKTTQGKSYLKNTCSNNQQLFFVIKPGTSNDIVGLVLDPGQQVQIDVQVGATFMDGCGSVDTTRINFKYFSVSPN
jgi:hypothetical protein